MTTSLCSTGEKPYECGYCGKWLCDDSTHKRHVRDVHTHPTHRYICPADDGCKKQFVFVHAVEVEVYGYSCLRRLFDRVQRLNEFKKHLKKHHIDPDELDLEAMYIDTNTIGTITRTSASTLASSSTPSFRHYNHASAVGGAPRPPRTESSHDADNPGSPRRNRFSGASLQIPSNSSGLPLDYDPPRRYPTDTYEDRPLYYQSMASLSPLTPLSSLPLSQGANSQDSAMPDADFAPASPRSSGSSSPVFVDDPLYWNAGAPMDHSSPSQNIHGISVPHVSMNGRAPSREDFSSFTASLMPRPSTPFDSTSVAEGGASSMLMTSTHSPPSPPYLPISFLPSYSPLRSPVDTPTVDVRPPSRLAPSSPRPDQTSHLDYISGAEIHRFGLWTDPLTTPARSPSQEDDMLSYGQLPRSRSSSTGSTAVPPTSGPQMDVDFTSPSRHQTHSRTSSWNSSGPPSVDYSQSVFPMSSTRSIPAPIATMQQRGRLAASPYIDEPTTRARSGAPSRATRANLSPSPVDPFNGDMQAGGMLYTSMGATRSSTPALTHTGWSRPSTISPMPNFASLHLDDVWPASSMPSQPYTAPTLVHAGSTLSTSLSPHFYLPNSTLLPESVPTDDSAQLACTPHDREGPVGYVDQYLRDMQRQPQDR